MGANLRSNGSKGRDSRGAVCLKSSTSNTGYQTGRERSCGKNTHVTSSYTKADIAAHNRP
jgi:hypothetical protein